MYQTTNYLLSQGVLGIVVLGLSWTVIRLYKDNKSLQKELSDLQSLRVEDAKETAEKIVPTLSSFSQTVNLIYSKLKISKEES